MKKDIKFLVRGNGGFLEAVLDTDSLRLKKTSHKVNPRDLIHFGTDVIGTESYHGLTIPNELRKSDLRKCLFSYFSEMLQNGADYLFISDTREESIPQAFVITAYLKK